MKMIKTSKLIPFTVGRNFRISNCITECNNIFDRIIERKNNDNANPHHVPRKEMQVHFSTPRDAEIGYTPHWSP